MHSSAYSVQCYYGLFCFSLRQYWRSALRKRPLPELESFRVRGSKYYDFCSYFIMPFSKTFLGGSWVVNVVYDPASLVPENLRVSLELVLSNRSQEIIDVGLHMHGKYFIIYFYVLFI